MILLRVTWRLQVTPGYLEQLMIFTLTALAVSITLSKL